MISRGWSASGNILGKAGRLGKSAYVLSYLMGCVASRSSAVLSSLHQIVRSLDGVCIRAEVYAQ